MGTTLKAPALKQNDKRPSWNESFLEVAQAISKRSDDLNTHVGCVIVGPDHEIRATGYNGMPRGVRPLPERLERPAKYLFTSHAEANAVGNAARVGVALRGCTAYVTHAPCDDCARLLIQVGIVRVVVGPGQTSMPPEKFEAARTMMLEAGIELD